MSKSNGFQLFNLLNINIVAGAMICHTVFLQLSQPPVGWFRVSTALLGISVFIIYTIDRLLDNRKKGQITTRRHAFHRKYQGQLLFTVEIFAVLGLYLLNKTDFRVILVGLGIAALSVGYLTIVSKMTLHHFLQAYKEPITALLYATGVWGTAVVQQHTPLSWTHWGIGLIFLLIAFQNLLLFSVYEQQNHPDVHSLASYLGPKRANQWIRYLFGLVLLLGLMSSYSATTPFEKSICWIEISMSGVLYALCFRQHFWQQHERYRWLGDGIFFLPAISLFLLLIK